MTQHQTSPVDLPEAAARTANGARHAAGSDSLTALLVANCQSETQHQVQLTFGLDFPKGVLVDVSRLRLNSPSGHRVLLQVTSLSLWSDGSVRWGLLDFVAEELTPGETAWQIGLMETSDSPLEQTPPGLDPPGNHLTLSVENARLQLRRGEAAAAVRFELTTKDGQLVTAKLGRSISESEGPIRWTRTIEGTFPGCSGIRFIARISTFRGTGRVKLDARLCNSNRARHNGGLWDLGDAGSFHFHSFEAIVESGEADSMLAFKTEAESEFAFSDSVKIYQDSSGRENWQSRNHINAAGRVPRRFRGYQTTWTNGSSRGHHATPTVRLTGESTSLTLALPEFWQQFPKSIEADSTSIKLGLFPADWDDLFELQGGEQKTHSLWLSLDPVPSPPRREGTELQESPSENHSGSRHSTI